MTRKRVTETFLSYSTRQQDARFTEWLRERSEPAWTQAIDHRFTHEIAEDRLDDEVFGRYLMNEYSFVETSATVLGYAIAKAPSIDQKARLAEALRSLTADQRAYFIKVFPALGISSGQRETFTFSPAVLSFRDTVLRAAAHGGYEESLATMLAAEWMYLTWSKRASQKAPVRPYTAEWIELHVSAAFEDHVSWMRGQLDMYGPALLPYRQAEVAYLFNRTLELEIAFHDAPFAG